MKVRIQREPDSISEAMQLLTWIAEGKDVERLEKRVKEIDIAEETWKPTTALLGKILKRAEKQFAGKMELVREYFTSMTPQDEDMLTLAEIALLAPQRRYDITLEQIEKELEDASEAVISRRILKMMDMEEAEDSFTTVIDALEETKLSREQKWQIMRVAAKPKEHFKKIKPLLVEAQELFFEYQKEWQPLIQEIAENWEAYLEEYGLKKLFQEYMNITLDENPNGVILIPEIMNGNKLWYFSDSKEKQRDIFRIGALFSTLENFKILTQPTGREQDEKEYLMQVMKCLSDKSKLGILLLLKEKRMYGSELAEALNLTTATISHHMNILILLKLVFMEKEENKAYYQLNREGIQNIMEKIKEILL